MRSGMTEARKAVNDLMSSVIDAIGPLRAFYFCRLLVLLRVVC